MWGEQLFVYFTLSHPYVIMVLSRKHLLRENIMTVTKLLSIASKSDCIACGIKAELTRMTLDGAYSANLKLRKSPTVRAAYVHTCK